MTYEKYSPKNKKGEALIKELLHNLQKEPSDVSMKKAIPANVSVDDFIPVSYTHQMGIRDRENTGLKIVPMFP